MSGGGDGSSGSASASAGASASASATATNLGSWRGGTMIRKADEEPQVKYFRAEGLMEAAKR